MGARRSKHGSDQIKSDDFLENGRQITLELGRLARNSRGGERPHRLVARLQRNGVLTRRIGALALAVVATATARFFGARIAPSRVRRYARIAPKLLFVLRGTPPARRSAVAGQH